MGGGINWEIGIDIDTLLYLKEKSNKDLLYSTGNYTQYFIITYKGKESGKEYIYICTHIYCIYISMYVCVCITESLCCTPETNMIL